MNTVTYQVLEVLHTGFVGKTYEVIAYGQHEATPGYSDFASAKAERDRLNNLAFDELRDQVGRAA
jgi:hypothetical protein